MGNTILHLAAKAGDMELLINVLRLRTSRVNATNYWHLETPLILVAKHGRDDHGTNAMIEALLQAGAHPLCKDRHERSAVDYCLENENLTGAKLLLQSLFVTKPSEQFFFETLFSKERDPWILNVMNSPMTPVRLHLDELDQSLLHHAATAGNLELCRLFLKHGCDPNAKTETGVTPLICAAMSSRRKWKASIIKLLLEAGAKLDDLTRYGWNALHLVANYTYGDIESVKILLEAGIDVNSRAEKDDLSTPLLIASRRGNIPVMHYLLSNGADPNMHDDKGRDSLFLAVEDLYTMKIVNDEEARERHGIIKCLLTCCGANLSPMTTMQILEWCDKRTVLTILKHGADWQQIYEYGRSGIHYAAENADPDVLELLLNSLPYDEDRKREMMRKCDAGYTALHCATHYKLLDNVRLLCENGADVNAKDGDGRTALSRLLRSDHQDEKSMLIVDLLLSWGSELTKSIAARQILMVEIEKPLSVSYFVVTQLVLRELMKHGGKLNDLRENKDAVINELADQFVDNHYAMNYPFMDVLLNKTKEFCKRILLELARMQEYTLYKKFSLFDAISWNSWYELAKRMRTHYINESLANLLPKLKSMWPIHGEMMHRRFEPALWKQLRLLVGRNAIRKIMPVPMGDRHVDMILDGMTTNDLKRLTDDMMLELSYFKPEPARTKRGKKLNQLLKRLLKSLQMTILSIEPKQFTGKHIVG